MRIRCLPIVIALPIAVSPVAATAQASAQPPITAASASPRAAKPTPRPLSPAESRDIAAPPGDLRPERPVTPQVTIPLRKTQDAAPKFDPRAARRSKPASTGGINDAAARCEAQSDEQARAKCLDKLAREARKR
jgi:hypothetical protein